MSFSDKNEIPINNNHDQKCKCGASINDGNCCSNSKNSEDENINEGSTTDLEDEEDLNKEENLESKEESEEAEESENNKDFSNNESELKDKLLRLTAEFDNYRKRTTKERFSIYTDSIVETVSKFLPILDNLERANSSIEDSNSIKQGIDMVIKLFNETLEKLGISEIDTSEGFDPKLHEAVMHIVDESLPANSIVEVFQKGYLKDEKVIRHSMVKVAN